MNEETKRLIAEVQKKLKELQKEQKQLEQQSKDVKSLQAYRVIVLATKNIGVYD